MWSLPHCFKREKKKKKRKEKENETCCYRCFCVSGFGRFQVGSLIVTGSYFQVAGAPISIVLYLVGWKWIMLKINK